MINRPSLKVLAALLVTLGSCGRSALPHVDGGRGDGSVDQPEARTRAEGRAA